MQDDTQSLNTTRKRVVILEGNHLGSTNAEDSEYF